ncbi:MAG: hypothetical protein DCC51_16965 [Anaerolineae bacterium]|nr:MAG: hypothetical protein DCC51_16965 [Anaerolineae bacterium]
MEHNELPTPPVLSGAMPVVGHALEFLRNRPALLQRGQKEVGPVFTVKLGPQNVVVMIGPEYHRVFFMETDKKLNIATPYKFLKVTFGEVLFIAGHDEYLRQKPFITQAFRREKMIHYIEVMGREVQKWLDSLGDEGEFEIVDTMGRLAQTVAGNALMGEEFMARTGREFWDLYGDITAGIDPILPPNLPLPRFIRRDRARHDLLAILQPILEERRANPAGYNDFLQDFVNAEYSDTGEPIEDEVLLNLMLGLMFAGHETTAGQAAWNVILLLQHPDYLKLVQDPQSISCCATLMRSLRSAASASPPAGRRRWPANWPIACPNTSTSRITTTRCAMRPAARKTSPIASRSSASAPA